MRGLFIFTAANYSIMYIRGDEPRADLPAEPTDADLIRAFGELTANSGRYTLEGDQLTYEAYMANNPNYMNR